MSKLIDHLVLWTGVAICSLSAVVVLIFIIEEIIWGFTV